MNDGDEGDVEADHHRVFAACNDNEMQAELVSEDLARSMMGERRLVGERASVALTTACLQVASSQVGKPGLSPHTFPGGPATLVAMNATIDENGADAGVERGSDWTQLDDMLPGGDECSQVLAADLDACGVNLPGEPCPMEDKIRVLSWTKPPYAVPLRSASFAGVKTTL